MHPNDTAVLAVTGLAAHDDIETQTSERPSGIYLRAAKPVAETIVDEATTTDAPANDADPKERDKRRSRRKRLVKARTISVKRTSKQELALGRALYPDVDVPRPVTRADCKDGPRPCPFVSCKHHLYLDVNGRTGAIKLNFPDLEVWEMSETCALDVADRAAATLEETGGIMNLTRERIRQLEVTGLAKLAAVSDLRELVDVVDGDGKRRLPILPPRARAEEEEREDEDEDEDDDLYASDDRDDDRQDEVEAADPLADRVAEATLAACAMEMDAEDTLADDAVAPEAFDVEAFVSDALA